MVTQPLRQFLDLARALGPLRATSIAARWLLRRDYLVYCRDLRLPLPEVLRPTGLTWQPLTQADDVELVGVNPLMTEREVRRRLLEGQTCLLGRLDGKLAYYRWDSTRPLYLPYLGKVFRPLPGDTIADESFTDPAFRGRGIDAAGALAVYRQAMASGCRRSITLVAWWNSPSQRTQAKAGRTALGTVGYRLTPLGRRYFASGTVCFDENAAVYVRNDEY